MGYIMIQSCKDYYNKIPANTLTVAVKGAGIATVFMIFVYQIPPQLALTRAGLIGLACVTHGFVSPIFQKLSGNINFKQISLKDRAQLLSLEYLRTGISMVPAHLAASYMGRSRQLLLPFKQALIINMVYSLIYVSQCNPYSAHYVIV